MNLRVERKIAAARINEIQTQIVFLQCLLDSFRPIISNLELYIETLKCRIRSEQFSVNSPLDTPEQKR